MKTALQLLLLLTLWNACCQPIKANPAKKANAPAPRQNPPPKPARPNIEEDAEMLRQAYRLMFRADHDYHGHRINAMRLTAAAAQRLGIVLRGDGAAGERQRSSDEQLREARGILQQVQANLARKRFPRVAECVHYAIIQIDIALQIA